jgi:hypothetical protein
MELISVGVVLFLLVLLFHVVRFSFTSSKDRADRNTIVLHRSYRPLVRRPNPLLRRRRDYQAMYRYQRMQQASTAYLDNVYRVTHGGRQ